MGSRKLEDLLPEVEVKARLFMGAMSKRGIPFLFTCTYRSQAEQDCLYAQGRNPLVDVNVMRVASGLYLLKNESENIVVTKTKKSRHTERTAFDIAIVKDGKSSWDLKVNVNANDIPDYEEAGKIGQLCGLTWGGDWDGDGQSSDEKFLDYPHFQLDLPPEIMRSPA